MRILNSQFKWHIIVLILILVIIPFFPYLFSKKSIRTYWEDNYDLGWFFDEHGEYEIIFSRKSIFSPEYIVVYNFDKTDKDSNISEYLLERDHLYDFSWTVSERRYGQILKSLSDIDTRNLDTEIDLNSVLDSTAEKEQIVSTIEKMIEGNKPTITELIQDEFDSWSELSKEEFDGQKGDLFKSLTERVMAREDLSKEEKLTYLEGIRLNFSIDE